MRRRGTRTSRRETRDHSSGRSSSSFCRLCHGKFSRRRLLQAFAQLQGEACGGVYPLFCADFQQLLGIRMERDPALSQFICTGCHAQFYRCHSILLQFRSRVNLTPPTAHSYNDAVSSRSGAEHSSSQEDISLIRSQMPWDRRCLLSLVSWAHGHAEGCSSCPGLQEVLEGPCGGALRAVWGCGDGHSYVMDSGAAASTHTTEDHTDEHAQPTHQQGAALSGSDPLRSAEPQNHSDTHGTC